MSVKRLDICAARRKGLMVRISLELFYSSDVRFVAPFAYQWVRWSADEDGDVDMHVMSNSSLLSLCIVLECDA